MVRFDYISARGDILPLTNGENYTLTGIDNQTGATANLSSSTIGGVDGDEVNNAQVVPRPLIFYLRITSEIEKTKRKILDIVKVKQRAKIRWEQNGRTVEIQGIVESVDMPRWNDTTTMQISMHCEQPYWEDIDEIIAHISEIINLHYFTDMPDDMLYFPNEGIVLGEYEATRTKTFHNAGDVSIGLEIEISALETVTNPIIYNTDGNYFGCGYGTGSKQVVMQAGDVIKINTRRNEKAVTLNGVSILGKIKPGSTWLQLAAGTNQFAINSDDASIINMSFTMTYKQMYI